MEIKKDMEIIASGILSQTSSGFKLTPLKLGDILVPQVLGIAMTDDGQEKNLVSTSSQVNKITSVAKQVGIKKILWITLILGLILGIIYYLKQKFS